MKIPIVSDLWQIVQFMVCPLIKSMELVLQPKLLLGFVFFPIFFVLFKDDIKPLSNTGSITPPYWHQCKMWFIAGHSACFYRWKPWEFDITFYLLCSFSRPWELVLESSSYPSLLAHIPTCLRLLNLCTVNSRMNQKHTTSNDGMTWHDNIVSVWWDIRLWHDCLNRALRSETFLSWAPAWDRGLGFASPGEKTYENVFWGL